MQEIFNFKGQEVRTVTIDDEPYFVGKDVAEILGYAKARNAIASHVDDEDKSGHPRRNSNDDHHQRVRSLLSHLI